MRKGVGLCWPRHNRAFSELTVSDAVRIHRVKEFNIEKTPITAQLWSQRTLTQTSIDVTEDTTTPSFLISKSPASCRQSISYNFSDSGDLRDAYIDARGHVLMGKILEDLDALAGNIATTHCDDNNPATRPLHFVTASVDKIKLSQPLRASESLILAGQVCWVGKSAMDIVMEIHNLNNVKKYNSEGLPALLEEEGSSSRLLSCFFTFVARHRNTGLPSPINQCKPSTRAEEELFKERGLLAAARKGQVSLPNASNKAAITVLLERGSSMEDMPALSHANAILMRRTSLENTLLCQPQNGNISGRVFGGFLMHRAYDLAMATAYTFAGTYPVLREVDQVTFKKPVDIGDLVRLKSRIVFASDDPVCPLARVEVTCQIVRPERSYSFVSNTFKFAFAFSDNVVLRRIVPSSQEEAEAMARASQAVAHKSIIVGTRLIISCYQLRAAMKQNTVQTLFASI